MSLGVFTFSILPVNLAAAPTWKKVNVGGGGGGGGGFGSGGGAGSRTNSDGGGNGGSNGADGANASTGEIGGWGANSAGTITIPSLPPNAGRGGAVQGGGDAGFIILSYRAPFCLI